AAGAGSGWRRGAPHPLLGLRPRNRLAARYRLEKGPRRSRDYGRNQRSGRKGPVWQIMTETILEVRNLTVRFGQIAAVNDVSFTLRRGETLGLVGESGSGKSSASRAILQINRPSSGEVRFCGEDLVSASGASLKALRKRMQMVFQDPRSSLDPRMTVGALLEEPLVIFRIGDRASRKAKVAEMLHLVGL